MQNQITAIALIVRLGGMVEYCKGFDPNKYPSRGGLVPGHRIFQKEILPALGNAKLSQSCRKAVTVVSWMESGLYSYGVIATKAEALIKCLRELHKITVPVESVEDQAIIEIEESVEETDKERLQRLGDEAMEIERQRQQREAEKVARRQAREAEKVARTEAKAEKAALIEEAKRLQPECWQLASNLGRRDECPMIPKGFSGLSIEEIETLRDELLATRDAWKAEILEREAARTAAKQAEESKAAERAEAKQADQAAQREARAELVETYNECRGLIRGLIALARERHVELEYIELPQLRECDAVMLAEARRGLKAFRRTIELRAIELDPKRSGRRVQNPKRLTSPLAKLASVRAA